MQNSSIVVNGLQTALTWASHHVVEIIIFCSIFLEVSKIKINPISAVVKFVFRSIRKEIADTRAEIKEDMEKMKAELTEQIDSLRDDQEKENEIINGLLRAQDMSQISISKWQIVEFANSIQNGQLHVRDEYRHILDEYRKYETMIAKYGLEDSGTAEEIEKVRKHYDQNKDSTSVYF